MKVIILNGPPGCGKDTLAAHLITTLPNTAKREFKERLMTVAAAIAGITVERLRELNSRALKNLPNLALPYGLSPREWLIYVSETMIKPHMGEHYFGYAAAGTLVGSDRTYVFADGGFDAEVDTIADRVGRKNILVLKITRPGHSFAGDSRKYISEGVAGTTLDLPNDGDETAYLTKATEVISIWLNS